MRKLLVLTGTLLVAASLGLGAWWAWPILFPSLPAGWLSTLSKADAALVQKRPAAARLALTPTPEKLPVSGWLQWEKRTVAVAQMTGAWAWASEAAHAAAAQYPGNADLLALEAWTLLKAGHADKALVPAQKVLGGTPWAGILTQAQVEAAGLVSGGWSALRSSVAEPGAAAYTAFDRLASWDPDPSLQKNALLSALSRGDLEGARRYLDVLSPAQRDRPPFNRLQALMAYDQGDWPRAAALLKSLPDRSPENLLVLADVYLHLGDATQAQVIYDQWRADRPDDLPLSLVVNRATLALQAGDPPLALQLGSQYAAAHPQQASTALQMATLEARYRLGEEGAVKQTLTRLAAQTPETETTIQAELLKDRLFQELVSVPQLWSLIHRHPDSAPLAERLAWLMVEQRDFAAARRVLALYQKSATPGAAGRDWWIPFLGALIAGAENHLDEADALFDQVPGAWRSAVFWADWGYTASVRSQQVDQGDRKPWLDKALERLTKALELAPPSQEAVAIARRSVWLTRRAEVQTALLPLEVPARRGALRSAATEDLRQATVLDPTNLRASFLLRQAQTPQVNP